MTDSFVNESDNGVEESVSPLPDFRGLEDNINSLVDVIGKDKEIEIELEEVKELVEILKQKEMDQELTEEEVKELEVLAAKEEEIKDFEEFYMSSVIDYQESGTEHLENLSNMTFELLGKIDLLVEQQESLQKTNVEGFYFIGFALVIAFAVKIFISEITKW